MCRNSKTFRGCGTLFLAFPFIFLYITTTTLLSDVEAAEALPSQREIQEAQKIVGQFIRNEAGTDWLSGLAKSAAAPLTTSDLMNAIIEKAKPTDEVRQAATKLLNALNSTTNISLRMDSNSGQSDNWKDLISNIEMEDDIICLYRKNSNETSKRADDWKQFLKAVSPGYTVHLAIDTGRKYVLCLKKIEVPETTSQATSTTAKKSVTTTDVSSTIPSTTTSRSSTKKEQSSMPSASRSMKSLLPKRIFQETDDNNLCKGKKDSVENPRSEEERFERINRNNGIFVTDRVVAAIGCPLNSRNLMNDEREWSEIRQMENYLTGASTMAADCSENLSDRSLDVPIIFVLFNPNDYFGFRNTWPTNLPVDRRPRSDRRWICQNRRCMLKPFSQGLIYANSPNSRRPTDSLRFGDYSTTFSPFFDKSNPWQSTIGLRSRSSKNLNFRPKILDEYPQENFFARRTLPRKKKPIYRETKIKSTPCLANPSRAFIREKNNIGNSIPADNYVDSKRSLRQKNRSENPKPIKNYAKQRYPPVQQTHWSPKMRPSQQPIIQPRKLWDYNKSPDKNIYSFISNSSPKPLKPLSQYFDLKDPNPLAFPGSRLKAPCQKSNCMVNNKRSWNYVQRPKPFSIPRTNSINRLIRLPLIYSQNLMFSENSGFNDISRRVKCPKACDKPIKLQVVINGKIQEPLDVSVSSDPGQKVDVVGLDNSMFPYKPGTPLNLVPIPTKLPDDTNTYFETEINTRMDVDKLNTKEDSLTESGLSPNNDLANETNSTTTLISTETTTLKPDSESDTSANVEEFLTHQTTDISTTVLETEGNTSTTTTISTTTV